MDLYENDLYKYAQVVSYRQVILGDDKVNFDRRMPTKKRATISAS